MHVRKEGPRKHYYGPGRFLYVSAASTARLAKALYGSDADIIQLCKPQPYNVIASRLGRRGRPVYCDCDDYEAETNRFSSDWQQRTVRYFEDGIIQEATGLTVNTHFTLQRYRDLGFPGDRIVYVPNGVDRRRFSARPEEDKIRQKWQIDPQAPLVVYVGTLGTFSHPVDLLLEAFQQVVQDLPAARLLLVGGGEDYDQLHILAEHLGIAEKTIFTGRVPPEEVPAYLAVAGVSVDPIHDNLIARARSPLKALESLAMGVPVVTGDVGDRRDLLGDGKLGVLVPAGDSRALAAGILSILRNPQKRASMSQAALANREDYYWDNLVADFARVYDL
jgi:glycosyltransferase involved in cell wall biosynthesis